MFEQQKVIAAAEKAQRELSQVLRTFYNYSALSDPTSFKLALPDRRRLRVQQIVAEIMQIVGPHLCEHGDRHGHRDVADKLFYTFYEAGIDFLTDQDRAELGLSPRNAAGWTAEEVQAFEARHLEAMLRPLPSVIMPDPPATPTR